MIRCCCLSCAVVWTWCQGLSNSQPVGSSVGQLGSSSGSKRQQHVPTSLCLCEGRTHTHTHTPSSQRRWMPSEGYRKSSSMTWSLYSLHLLMTTAHCLPVAPCKTGQQGMPRTIRPHALLVCNSKFQQSRPLPRGNMMLVCDMNNGCVCKYASTTVIRTIPVVLGAHLL